MLRNEQFWDARATSMGSWIWRKLLKYRLQSLELIRMNV